MSTIISPSVLAFNFLNLQENFNVFNSLENLWYHIDVMDGNFVPNMSFGTPVIRSISKIAKHPMDVHLMVINPELHLEMYRDFSVHNITFHLEAVDDPISFIHKAKKLYPSVGISIKPGTPLSDLSAEVLSLIDLVLIMSVEPGFGGQSFMENSLEKISTLKALRETNNYKYIIQVDGGINNETAKLVRKAGADNLVSGSYILKQVDSKAAISSLL